MLIKYQCVRKRREIDLEGDNFQRKADKPSITDEPKKSGSGCAVGTRVVDISADAEKLPASQALKMKQLAELSNLRMRSFSQPEGVAAGPPGQASPLPLSPGAAGKLVNTSSKTASTERRKSTLIDSLGLHLSNARLISTCHAPRTITYHAHNSLDTQRRYWTSRWTR